MWQISHRVKMVNHHSPSATNQPMYVISIAAKMVNLHPQTLRHYENLGLVTPQRSRGNIRLYSPADIDRLRQINRLTDELGVNLAGVQIILDMRERLKQLQLEMDAMQAELKAEISRLRKRLFEGS
jgi:MerR family transcriptional regulator/heat shock protein HspR